MLSFCTIFIGGQKQQLASITRQHQQNISVHCTMDDGMHCKHAGKRETTNNYYGKSSSCRATNVRQHCFNIRTLNI